LNPNRTARIVALFAIRDAKERHAMKLTWSTAAFLAFCLALTIVGEMTPADARVYHGWHRHHE
jgi:hypothetical protein